MKTATIYTQVKNANPVFTVPQQKGGNTEKRTLPFNKMLMNKVRHYTQSWSFTVLVAMSRARGRRSRRPPVLRCRAIDALLQGLCFHYDPLANRVNVTMTTLACECGLATETKGGKLSICRATRALKYLADELNIITYSTVFDPEVGCYLPTDITLTALFFESIEVSEEAVEAARKSRAEYKNIQRVNMGKPKLSLERLISDAWSAFRKRFREYRLMFKSRGEKRAKARKEAALTFREVSALVRKELTREIATGQAKLSLSDISSEIKRRVKERMILSRCGGYRITPVAG